MRKEAPSPRYHQRSLILSVILHPTYLDLLVGLALELSSLALGLALELGSLAKAPDLVEVEFGIKLSADAGLIIARAGSEASLRVKIGWKKAA